VDPSHVLGEILNQPEHSALKGKISEMVQPGKYEYLMRSCALMVNSDFNFVGYIAMERFMLSLRFLNSKLSEDEIWFLAEAS
jgi:hypothetical protein